MQAKPLLEWYLESGVDETIAEHPHNRLQQVTLPAMAKTAVKLNAPVSRPAANNTSSSIISPAAAIAEARRLADSAQSLEELVGFIKEFSGCALKKTATNTVVFDGNPKSKLVLVGEAPGAEEDKQGIPFCGPSGQLLDKMLGTIGIDRTKCLITNTVYWRPPGNRQPTPEELEICKPLVQRLISFIDPTLMVMVGGTAAKAVLGTMEAVTKLRSQTHFYTTPYMQGKKYPVAITFHPSYLLRSPGQKRYAWHDMLKIKELLN